MDAVNEFNMEVKLIGLTANTDANYLIFSVPCDYFAF